MFTLPHIRQFEHPFPTFLSFNLFNRNNFSNIFRPNYLLCFLVGVLNENKSDYSFISTIQQDLIFKSFPTNLHFNYIDWNYNFYLFRLTSTYNKIVGDILNFPPYHFKYFFIWSDVTPNSPPTQLPLISFSRNLTLILP